jgi:hypothetical protein
MVLPLLTHMPESPHKTIPAFTGPAYFDGPTLLSPDGEVGDLAMSKTKP